MWSMSHIISHHNFFFHGKVSHLYSSVYKVFTNQVALQIHPGDSVGFDHKTSSHLLKKGTLVLPSELSHRTYINDGHTNYLLPWIVLDSIPNGLYLIS